MASVAAWWARGRAGIVDRPVATYTRYTARWLDRRYRECAGDGVYLAHQPLYGLGHPASEPGRLARLARLFQVLRSLDGLRWGSLLDVGGGEGFLAHLARAGAARAGDAVRVVSCDLSAEACARAGELFAVPAAAIDGARLPFADDAFDVVVCSEVVEHAEYPVACLLELQRVAAKAVIVTTEEIAFDRAAIERHLFRRCGYPHAERNLFHPDDLALLFGAEAPMRSQYRGEAPAEDGDKRAAADWIRSASPPEGLHADGTGVVIEAITDPGALATRRLSDDELLDLLLGAPHAVPGGVAMGPPLQVLGGGVESLATAGYDPTAVDVAAAAARLWPGDAQRAAAVVALSESLVMPIDPTRTRWDFGDPAAREGWMTCDDLPERESGDGGRSGGGGGWALRSTGDDPWLAGPGLAVRAADVVAIEVTMRLHNPDHPVEGGQGQVFWMGVNDTGLVEERSVLFPVLNDGRVHSYRVDPRPGGRWPPDDGIIFVRLDPANGPCEVDLHGFAFVLRGDAGGDAGEASATDGETA